MQNVRIWSADELGCHNNSRIFSARQHVSARISRNNNLYNNFLEDLIRFVRTSLEI